MLRSNPDCSLFDIYQDQSLDPTKVEGCRETLFTDPGKPREIMEITPSDYLPAEQAEGASQDELQQHHFDHVAQNLNTRRQNEYLTTQITDEDIDGGLGGIHPALAENEANLQHAIAQASRATNPTERARWQALAEQYAARSVVSRRDCQQL